MSKPTWRDRRTNNSYRVTGEPKLTINYCLGHYVFIDLSIPNVILTSTVITHSSDGKQNKIWKGLNLDMILSYRIIINYTFIPFL